MSMAMKAIKCSKMFDSQNGKILENMVIFVDGDKISLFSSADYTLSENGSYHIRKEGHYFKSHLQKNRVWGE